MKSKWAMALFCIVFLALLVGGTAWSQEPGFAFTTKSFDELGEMEFSASNARELFWKGEYADALDVFKKLNLETHASSCLYWSEMAMCQLAMGDYESAENNLALACQFSETVYDPKSEKAAMSKFGQEGQKIYIGDPYERAFQYMILALLFMQDNDWDNALAACKSGLLADSDSVENRYQSDLTLLYLLEAKCHMMRGDEDTAEQLRNMARESYRSTSPDVRELFSQRLNEIAKLKLSKKERKKADIKEDDGAIQARIDQLSASIASAAAQAPVDEELGVLLSGNYNTLVVIPQGQGPEKMRKGKNANLIFFESHGQEHAMPVFLLDGGKMESKAAPHVAEVDFQATTRGGRRMDAILNGQAAFRETTANVGSALTEAGNQVGGIAGLGAALIGAAVQGVAGAVNPEADTRCWQTLPSEFVVYALDLPQGNHDVVFYHNLYFERTNEFKKSFAIGGDNGMAVILAPPSPAGLFAGASCSIPSGKDAANPVVMVTPPLGFSTIERFVCVDNPSQTQAFAPDSKRIMRSLDKALRQNAIPHVQMGHEAALEEIHKDDPAAPLALQVYAGDFSFNVAGKNTSYQCDFTFSLVNTRSGAPVFKEAIQGQWVKDRKEDKEKGCTEAFYECLKIAAATFLNNPGIRSQFNSATAMAQTQERSQSQSL